MTSFEDPLINQLRKIINQINVNNEHQEEFHIVVGKKIYENLKKINHKDLKIFPNKITFRNILIKWL